MIKNPEEIAIEVIKCEIDNSSDLIFDNNYEQAKTELLGFVRGVVTLCTELNNSIGEIANGKDELTDDEIADTIRGIMDNIDAPDAEQAISDETAHIFYTSDVDNDDDMDLSAMDDCAACVIDFGGRKEDE